MNNIFDLILPRFKLDKNKKTRLITLFSGYDSQKLAFNYIDKNVEHYKAIEFDKYVVQTLNEIHNTNFETIDIKSIGGGYLDIVDKIHYQYIMTYSFPCTDLSLAGKRRGMAKDSGTRSSLLWQVERLLNETKELPDVLIMENVKQVLTADGWEDWRLFLEQKGYSNYAEVLNAKNYGIPQNRERCFMVSILGEYNYTFPKKIKLEYKLKDLLDTQVDEKYFISEKMILGMKKTKFNSYNYNNNMTNKKIIKTLTASTGEKAPLFIEIPEATKTDFKQAFEGDSVYINRPYQKRGVVQNNIAITLKTQLDIGVVVKDTENYIEWKTPGKLEIDCRAFKEDKISSTTPKQKVLLNNLRIRRLTPKECFRLMGVKDSDSNKITCSDTQKYKQAGNSIVTTCLMAIYSQLYDDVDYVYYIEKLLKQLKE